MKHLRYKTMVMMTTVKKETTATQEKTRNLASFESLCTLEQLGHRIVPTARYPNILQV